MRGSQPPGNLYAASLYWSMMTLTSVGFGDIAATFNNPVEMTVCSFLMLASSLVWAQVIGTFCGVIATFNPEQNAFQARSTRLQACERIAGVAFPIIPP